MKRLAFNVLLRGKGVDGSAGLGPIDRARPPREDVETCHHWLQERGVTCHLLDFGLACESTVECFEVLFNVRIRVVAGGFEMEGEPTAPEEIDLIGSFGCGLAGYDASELASMDAIFGDRLPNMPAIATQVAGFARIQPSRSGCA